MLLSFVNFSLDFNLMNALMGLNAIISSVLQEAFDAFYWLNI